MLRLIWRLRFTLEYTRQYPCRWCNIKNGWNRSKDSLEDYGFRSDPIEVCELEITEDRLNDNTI